MNNKNDKNRRGRKSKTDDVFFPVPPSKQDLPGWYANMLQQVKELVAQERKLALWEANARMSMMYYHIGKAILAQREQEGWGTHVIDRLLELHIENFTLEREGKLPTNFDKFLPDSQSDMVKQMFKDPYLLDFTGADGNSREKEIEDGLTQHITNFLLELGQGFSFVGRQVHLEMDGHDYYIDMLFYHLQLRRFVVIELKAVPFTPEMMGQLAFYQTVVDHTLRHETDEPTIGLLLVKSKSETIVKYSLESINKPIGVASWETEISKEIAGKWKSTLPTIEEIEKELDANYPKQ